ncbi:MAG TPA: HAD family hydrolase [Polyangia bacterium]|nr:HAD family hydrolase [Polyangia bacterium]
MRNPLRGPIKATIFDLDGTLTEPLLDFDAMRAEIGLPPGPILEQLAHADAATRARADEILRRHEREAIARATLADGCAELLACLASQRIPAAILTRNVREVVDIFVRTFGFTFAAVYTREDGPHKPAPDGVFALCAAMGAAPAHTLVVGDYKFDILAGRAAGCPTALVTTTHAPTAAELPDWGPPDLVVASLRELLPRFVA